MANIYSLPAELLHRALAHLSQPDISMVCRSCKLLQQFAEQRLYESIEFLFESAYCGQDNAVLPIHKFFRTIWRRPEHAAHVKSARFAVEDADGPDVLRVPPPADIRQALVDAWIQTGLPHEGVDERIEKGEASTFTAVVVARLYHLAELDVGYILLQQSPNIARVLLHLFGSPATNGAADYRGLTRLSVTNDLDSKIIRVNNSGLGLYDPNLAKMADTMLSFFALRTLEEADLVLDSEPEPVPWRRHRDDNHAFSLPRLRRLGLLNCGASPATLRCILAETPRLETLEFFFVQDLEGLKTDEDYALEHRDEWHEFAAALNPVHESLKNLTISVDWAFVDDIPPDTMDDEWVGGIWQRRGDVGSLRHLARLERLEVPIFVLLGWTPSEQQGRDLADVLPSSLRELCLRDDLVDFGEYNWTPWNANVIGSQVAESFLNTCDPTAVLRELRKFLAPPSPALTRHTGIEERTALQALCLKMQTNRVWPLEYLMELETICRRASISCTVRMRMSGLFTNSYDWSDEVREIIIYDPLAVKSEGQSPEMDTWETENSEKSLNPNRNTPEQEAPGAEDLARKATRPCSPPLLESSCQYPDLWEDVYEYRYLSEPRRLFQSHC